MKRWKAGPWSVLVLAALFSLSSSAQKIKVIVDQDARGPGTSDQQAILVFLQSDKFDVLGITTVSGDQWVKEETQHVLRLLEIAHRTDVPRPRARVGSSNSPRSAISGVRNEKGSR